MSFSMPDDRFSACANMEAGEWVSSWEPLSSFSMPHAALHMRYLSKQSIQNLAADLLFTLIHFLSVEILVANMHNGRLSCVLLVFLRFSSLLSTLTLLLFLPSRRRWCRYLLRRRRNPTLYLLLNIQIHLLSCSRSTRRHINNFSLR